MLVPAPTLTSRSRSADASTRAVGSITCRLLLVGRPQRAGRTRSISPFRLRPALAGRLVPSAPAEETEDDAECGTERDRAAPVEHRLHRALDPPRDEQEDAGRSVDRRSTGDERADEGLFDGGLPGDDRARVALRDPNVAGDRQTESAHLDRYAIGSSDTDPTHADRDVLGTRGRDATL